MNRLLRIENLLLLVPVVIGALSFWGIEYLMITLTSAILWLLFLMPAWMMHYFLRVTNMRSHKLAALHVWLTILGVVILYFPFNLAVSVVPGWQVPVRSYPILNFDLTTQEEIANVLILAVQLLFIIYGIRRISRWRRQVA